jgi:hypothetical protein
MMILWLLLNIGISCTGVFVSMAIYRRRHKDVVTVDHMDQVGCFFTLE